ncbi:hypothetical protein PR002_g19559 [Phytophthora rubi]|uniref:Uncharacterized protein n=1 Tax=Phytophthora rubi TaxID=129364 RepID=A0A6A3JL11_9STRA|nr:hypothetical protein PR002_g19559 [Phytophthora rubi]
MTRVDEEGLDLQEIYGAQQRPKVPVTRWNVASTTLLPTATAGTALTATATAATATATAATVTVTAATPIATAATVTATAATPTATAATATVTAATATATAATTTATPTMTDPPLAQAAAKRPAATKPKQAAKATPETLRSSSPRTVVAPAKVARAPRAASKATRGRATAKRKATTPRAPSKRRKNADLPENTAEDVPDEAMGVAETNDRGVPEVAVAAEDDTEPIVTEVQNTPRRVPEIPTAVPLDDFDSDNFLDALRRDRLFTPADADDLNVGEADWLLSLDLDVEGDEETILLDEAEGADKDDSVEADVEDDESNHDGNAEEEAPLEFDLSDDELNRLQANGWDTFDEHHSNQVLHDAAPLYEGPWGPTHAVLANQQLPQREH